jgi:thiol-disulfide isomerase/thioredoxin
MMNSTISFRRAGLGMMLAVLLHSGAAPVPPAVAGEGRGGALVTALADGSLHTLDGSPLPRPGTGGVLVVNFWATWCKPCKGEMPLLDELHRRLGETGGAVIAISIDRKPERVSDFVAELGLGLPVCVDGPEGLAERLDLEYLPYTFVLDGAGRILHEGAGGKGENWAAVEETVDRLLAQDREPSSPETRGM